MDEALAANPDLQQTLLTLASKVSGQVQSLAEDFEPGKRFKKGEILARLEDSDYRAAVAAADHDLSDARLSLLEEDRKALQAKAEWEASGVSGKPASELVLHKPQVAAAEAAVANARAAQKPTAILSKSVLADPAAPVCGHETAIPWPPFYSGKCHGSSSRPRASRASSAVV
ncbi:MAG: hypothetical protein R6U41_07000 [Desulfosalsimonas sp.]|uniref:hypothetical protein n=1 Tax=Desulfosalsimonas sp. TaxID=3073848 RepID=UPI003970DE81